RALSVCILLRSGGFLRLEQEGDFLFQQHRITDIELNQAAQVRDTVEVHAFALDADLHVLYMCDAPPEHDDHIGSQLYLQTAAFIRLDVAAFRQSHEGAPEGQV